MGRIKLEVVRDAKNNMITICFIENIDPLGVHAGDSFCSAPMPYNFKRSTKIVYKNKLIVLLNQLELLEVQMFNSLMIQ